MLISQEISLSQLRWSNLAPFFLNLQKRADFRVLVTITVTTNTISGWFVEQDHAILIDTISSLASRGLSMKSIADTLNDQGYVSHSGKAFYPELVGALISKYRKKAKSRYMHKLVILKNENGGFT